jgi:hypothetical protein
MAWTLPLIGAIGVLAPGPGPAAGGTWTTRPGAVPAKGISPTCLLVPQDQGCEGGIIS